MKTPKHVTFTGLDERTDLDHVRAISARYPVEWGILFSPMHQGRKPRYPDLPRLRTIVDRLANLDLAAHLCGGYARSVLMTASCPEISGILEGSFDRFQINTAMLLPDELAAASFAGMMGGTAILQCRDGFPTNDRVEWLQDRSGGTGTIPGSWFPAPPYARRVGYSGGLGPETIESALAGIRAAVPDRVEFWIDMETGVRTDDYLDLAKCEAVLRAVYGDR